MNTNVRRKNQKRELLRLKVMKQSTNILRKPIRILRIILLVDAQN